MKRFAKKATATTIACAWLAMTSICSYGGSVTQSESMVKPTVDSDTSWRLTKFGWQDSTTWVSDTFAPQPTWELVHPVIWAMLVLLTVLVVTIWASSEWEFARLFQQAERQEEEA